MKQLLILLALFTMACSTEQDVPTPTNPADKYVLRSLNISGQYSRQTKIYLNGVMVQGNGTVLSTWAESNHFEVKDSMELIVDGKSYSTYFADHYNKIELLKVGTGIRTQYSGTYIRVMLYNE